MNYTRIERVDTKSMYWVNYRLLLLIFILLTPDYIEYRIGNIVLVLRAACCIYVFIKSIGTTYDNRMYCVIIYYLLLLLPTIYYRGDFLKYISNFAGCFSFCLLLNNYIQKGELTLFLHTIDVILILFFAIQFISAFAYKDGLYRVENDNMPYYFFGHKNISAAYASFCCFIRILNNEHRGNKSNVITYLMIIMNTGMLIYIKSMTVLIAFILSLAILYMMSISTRIRVSYRLILVLSVLFSVGLIFFQVQTKFGFIIENILHKDMTLTTRTYIWTKALRSLEGHYIFGYGVQSNEVIRSVLSLTSTHNGWFDFIYRGGVILFTFMFIVLYRVGAIINRLYDLKEVKIVTAALVFFLIRFLAEPQPEAITLAFLFTLLILLYSIDISVDYCLL